MAEPFGLHPDELRALLDLFVCPIPAAWLGDHDQTPAWVRVAEEEGAVLLRNGSWAVARARVEGGLAVGVELLEPERAREVWRRHGFLVAPAERVRLLAFLVPGLDADEALDALFTPRRIGLRALSEEGGRRWYRLHDSGVLALDVDADGTIASVTLLEGEEAADRAWALARARGR